MKTKLCEMFPLCIHYLFLHYTSMVWILPFCTKLVIEMWMNWYRGQRAWNQWNQLQVLILKWLDCYCQTGLFTSIKIGIKWVFSLVSILKLVRLGSSTHPYRREPIHQLEHICDWMVGRQWTFSNEYKTSFPIEISWSFQSHREYWLVINYLCDWKRSIFGVIQDRFIKHRSSSKMNYKCLVVALNQIQKLLASQKQLYKQWCICVTCKRQKNYKTFIWSAPEENKATFYDVKSSPWFS